MAPPAPAPLLWRSDFDKFVVTANFQRRGWQRWHANHDSDWNVYWANVHTTREIFAPENGIRLGEHQRVNHFPNHYELTRKDNLIKNLKRTQRALLREGLEEEAAAYDFFPGTYTLPADYGLFVEEYKTHPPNAIWIMKPVGKAQGKGIFLFNRLSESSDCNLALALTLAPKP